MLLHLDMLIFAPSTKRQRGHTSIQHTINDRINAAFCGDIAYLFHSAMAVKRQTQNTRQSNHSLNRSAQLAADNDNYRTAVARACTTQSVATIGTSNLSHTSARYTQSQSPTAVTPIRHRYRPTSHTPSQATSAERSK